MDKTTIYLPTELRSAVKRAARRRGISEAEVIRDSIRNQAQYAWTRGVKFYENLKIVYQIQNTLSQLQQQDEEQRPAADSEADGRKLPVRTPGRDGPGRTSPSDSTGKTR